MEKTQGGPLPGQENNNANHAPAKQAAQGTSTGQKRKSGVLNSENNVSVKKAKTGAPPRTSTSAEDSEDDDDADEDG